MGLARPQGIVLERSVAAGLTQEVAAAFGQQRVYVRGGAEAQGIQIHYTADRTTIPADNLRPLDKPKWQRKVVNTTFAKLKKKGSNWWHTLPSPPRKPDEISVLMIYRRGSGRFVHDARGVEYIPKGSSHFIQIPLAAIVEHFSKLKVPGTSEIRVQIDYEE
jgi:hypothetical protein